MKTIDLDSILKTYDYAKIINEQKIPPLYKGYTVTEDMVTMKDGIRLKTYTARPIGADIKLPVILRRTPYGLGSLRFFFEMSLYGYICVMQSCRGRDGSEGIFIPGTNEKNDTLDTIEWIKKIPDFDGNMAMCGPSYLSMEQWQVGGCAPDELKTLYIEVYNPYRYMQLYTKGMFRTEAYAGWAAYNAGIKGADIDLYEKAVRHVPQIRMDREVLKKDLSWYRDWVSTPNPAAELWHADPWKSLESAPQELNRPVFIHAGWYDPHMEGMFKAYLKIPKEIRNESVFLTAPFNHKGSLSADIDLSSAYNEVGTRFVKSKLNWFNHMLKGEELPDYLTKGRAHFYVLGADKWVNTDYTGTAAKKTVFYLNTDKRTADSRIPANEVPIKYIYDPKNPVPTWGSEVIMTDYMYNHRDFCHGIRLQKEPNYRQDVISFISDTIMSDITITGASVSLDAATTARDTAFTAKLCYVDKDGKSYNLRESITSVGYEHKDYVPNKRCQVKIEFFPIAFTFKKGERLRLDVSSSSCPAFHVHPNTQRLWAAEDNPVTAEQTLYGGTVILDRVNFGLNR